MCLNRANEFLWDDSKKLTLVKNRIAKVQTNVSDAIQASVDEDTILDIVLDVVEREYIPFTEKMLAHLSWSMPKVRPIA